jgi:hypothetical protein
MPRTIDTSLPGGSIARTISVDTGADTPRAPITVTPPSSFDAAERRRRGGSTVPGVEFGRGTGTGGRRSLLEVMSPFFSTPFGRTRDDAFTDRFTYDNTSIAQTRILNNEFIIQSSNGINNLRPELLSKLDFSPIWKPSQLNVRDVLLRDTSTIGDFINFQYQTKLLRQETLAALISNMKKELPVDPFPTLKTDFEDELRKIDGDLEFLNTILNNIKKINSVFDIKSYADPSFKISENGTLVEILTLRELLTQRMQFSLDQYNRAAETKLLLQILFDLTNCLNNYSVNLIDLTDNDRVLAQSPTSIDKTYTLAQNSNLFNLKNFGRSVQRGTPLETYDYLLQSLPEAPDDVIKLLTYCLAKEYLVSTGLGDPSNAELLNRYSSNVVQGNFKVFENIIGPIGDNIFQIQSSVGNNNAANTLSSLLYVDTGNPNINVLPFENRYIQSDDNLKTFVPGSSYFTDAIITTDGSTWNLTPFTNYAARFNTVFTNAKSTINALLKLDSFSRTGQDVAARGVSATVIAAMSPSELNLMYAEKFQKCTTTFDTFEEVDQNRNNINATEANRILNQIRNYSTDAYNRLLLGAVDANLTERRLIARSEIDAIARLREASAAANGLDSRSYINYADQIFSCALFREAGINNSNNNSLRKVAYTLTLMAGIWKNASSAPRSNFFQKLVETEFKTFGDILNMFTSGGSLDSLRSVDTNPNSPSFNSEQLYGAITLFFNSVLAQIIENVIEQKITVSSLDSSSPWSVLEAFHPIIPTYQLAIQEGTRPEEPARIYHGLRDGILKMLFGERVAIDTIFFQVISAIEQLYNSTKISGQFVHIDTNGKTAFNQLSLSAQLLFTFETYVQYAKRYTACELVGKLDINDFSYINTTLDALNQAYSRIDSNTATNAQQIAAFREAQSLTNSLRGAASLIPYIAVRISPLLQSDVNKAINLIKEGRTAPSDFQEGFYGLQGQYLLANHLKISNEFNNIKDMLGIYQVINNLLTRYSFEITTFFNQPQLQTFLGNSSINNIDFLRYPSQIRLANYIYQDIVDKTTYSGGLVTLPAELNASGSINPLIVSDNITPSEYNAMISMLSSNQIGNYPNLLDTIPNISITEDIIYRNNKIVTIGIPTGLTKTLNDKVSVSQFNLQGIGGKQSDVIQVSIYPNDLRFPELIFKPFNYIFDLSLFVGKKDFYDLAAADGETFAALLSRMTVKDYEDPYNVQNITNVGIRNDVRYDFLSTAQRDEIFKNAITSYLLGLYINCLTGIKLSEDVFINHNSKRVLNPKTVAAIKTFLSKIRQPYNETYIDTEAILTNPNLSQNVKDTYRLMSYGSLMFNNMEATKRVNSSKTFDRVLHIPVNLRWLAIDVEATRSTLAGRMALERASLLEYIVPGIGDEETYITTNSLNDFIIKDIFCAVSQIPTGTTVVGSR